MWSSSPPCCVVELPVIMTEMPLVSGGASVIFRREASGMDAQRHAEGRGIVQSVIAALGAVLSMP